jgi:hypothetical protein
MVLSRPVLRVLLQVFLLGLFFVAGYLAAGWRSGTRDTTALAKICARVDYVNGLQQENDGQQASSEEARNELNAVVEQCRVALRNRAEEND